MVKVLDTVGATLRRVVDRWRSIPHASRAQTKSRKWQREKLDSAQTVIDEMISRIWFIYLHAVSLLY